MGAWIEIVIVLFYTKNGGVAPYMGAWIEIKPCLFRANLGFVAPYMGAWIEIRPSVTLPSDPIGRSLYGGVD